MRRGYRGTTSGVERGFRDRPARVVCAAMAATLIDGKAIALKVRQEVAKGTRELEERTGRVPGLAVIRVGRIRPARSTSPASRRRAPRSASVLGAPLPGRRPTPRCGPARGPQRRRLGARHPDPAPRPEAGELGAAPRVLRPEKDVDGLHRPQRRALCAWDARRTALHARGGDADARGDSGCKPARQAGGRRRPQHPRWAADGSPPAQRGRDGDDLSPQERPAAEVSRADILVVAAGVPELVKGDWIKPGRGGHRRGHRPAPERQAGRGRGVRRRRRSAPRTSLPCRAAWAR